MAKNIKIKLIEVDGELFIPLKEQEERIKLKPISYSQDTSSNLVKFLTLLTETESILYEYDEKSISEQIMLNFSLKVNVYTNIFKSIQHCISNCKEVFQYLELNIGNKYCEYRFRTDLIEMNSMSLIHFFYTEDEYIIEIPHWIIKESFFRIGVDYKKTINGVVCGELFLPERGSYFFVEEDSYVVVSCKTLGMFIGCFTAYFQHIQRAISMHKVLLW